MAHTPTSLRAFPYLLPPVPHVTKTYFKFSFAARSLRGLPVGFLCFCRTFFQDRTTWWRLASDLFHKNGGKGMFSSWNSYAMASLFLASMRSKLEGVQTENGCNVERHRLHYYFTTWSTTTVGKLPKLKSIIIRESPKLAIFSDLVDLWSGKLYAHLGGDVEACNLASVFIAPGIYYPSRDFHFR